jgi:hypothetical protein
MINSPMHKIHRAQASAILAALKLEFDRIHLADPSSTVIPRTGDSLNLFTLIGIRNLLCSYS